MEITITEALRIKNELSNGIKQISYGIHQASFGTTTEDGEIISEDKNTFVELEESLIKSLEYSEFLNNSIASFNKINGVDSKVRKMQNSKLLLGIYTRSLPKTKATKNKRFENLGTVRQSVEIEYVPFLNGTEIKARISQHKSIIRELQTEIEKINQNKIKVEFSYQDIENLIG